MFDDRDYPKILFVGPGECGKDTACRWFGRHTRLIDAGPTSLLHAREIAAALDLPVEEAYRRRRQDRKFWREWLDQYTADDPARLVREAFRAGDVANGVRRAAELEYARRESLADLVVWLHNPSVPQDPTLEFGPEVSDLVIVNDRERDPGLLFAGLRALAGDLELEIYEGRCLDID